VSKKPRKKKVVNRSGFTATTRAPSSAPGPHGRQQKTSGVPLALARQERPLNTATPAALSTMVRSTRGNATAARPATTTLRVDEEQRGSHGCAPATVVAAEPQGLAATYTWDAPASGEPYSTTVRFTGTRVGVNGTHDARDRFEQTERVEGLRAGTGPVALTTRVQGINAGEWRVTASPITQPGAGPTVSGLPRRVIATRTVFGQLAQGPAVRLAAWPLLVGLGAVVAIALQALLAARSGISVVAVLAVSLLGCLLGFVGGKAWYLVLHRQHPRAFLTAGACIQGFLVVALGVVALGAALLRLPAGTLLDVTTPGVFFGMALGRPGCFLTGCCAGRPTSSRWGLRSSDRRLAVRRFPVQLLEAAAALAIGVASLALVLVAQPPIPGVIFVGSLAAYTFCRQLLFPFRTESRTSRGRTVTMAASGLVLVGVLGVSVLL
jgi:phosphatidylglycerol:prolipoprotein diacylglycerol transferase